MEKIKHLLAVIETVKRHGTPDDPGAAEFFLNGFDQYMKSSEYKTLDKVFGLTSKRGTPSLRTQYMKNQRNYFLKEAFKHIDPSKPATVRCDILAKEILAMENRIYRNWESTGGPPEQCSELRRFLYLAKKTGQRLPTKSRYLFNLINGY